MFVSTTYVHTMCACVLFLVGSVLSTTADYNCTQLTDLNSELHTMQTYWHNFVFSVILQKKIFAHCAKLHVEINCAWDNCRAGSLANNRALLNFEYLARYVRMIIDCIDYVTGIGNVIQAPPHSLLRANTFSVGQQATNF